MKVRMKQKKFKISTYFLFCCLIFNLFGCVPMVSSERDSGPSQFCIKASDCAHEVALAPCARFCREGECDEVYVHSDCKAYNRESYPQTISKRFTTCALWKICRKHKEIICSSLKCVIVQDN